MNHHSNDVFPCPLCEEKLAEAHPLIAQWFREKVKPRHKDAHISWSYRDKTNQNQCYAEGKSKLPYPKSKHNKTDEKGIPCSQALDLFKLASNGMACWEWLYFKAIFDEVVLDNAPIIWGGIFKSISDHDHFELKNEN